MRAVVFGTLLLVAVAGCRDDKPATFTANGVVLLPMASLAAQNHDAVCTAPAGTSDIHEGTQVVIGDRSGATVGLGRLTIGKVHKNPLSPEWTGCAFTFAVDGVPAGGGFYQVKVADRSAKSFREADLASSTDPPLVVVTPTAG